MLEINFLVFLEFVHKFMNGEEFYDCKNNDR